MNVNIKYKTNCNFVIQHSCAVRGHIRLLESFYNQKLNRSKCIGIGCDAARVVSETRTGLIAFINGLAPQVVCNHCRIYKESLEPNMCRQIIKMDVFV